MRFLPEQKQKRIWSLVLFAVSVGGIIYLNLFAGPPPAAPVPPVRNPAAGTAARLMVRNPQGGLLPYGAGITTDVLARDKFKALIPGPAMAVSEGELGKDDLFAK